MHEAKGTGPSPKQRLIRVGVGISVRFRNVCTVHSVSTVFLTKTAVGATTTLRKCRFRPDLSRPRAGEQVEEELKELSTQYELRGVI